MELYKLLSENYDSLFPVSGSEIDFLQRELDGKVQILDVGCGTGSKTVLLAAGRRVLGIDDNAEMIDVANRLHSGPGVSYLALGMADMSGRLAPNSFDGVVCVGNTLSHLAEPGQVTGTLGQIRELMLPDGVFVGQILNFDRLFAQGISSLPVIETDTVIFRRSYEWEGADMRFCIELEDRRTGEIERSSTPMRPILKSTMDSVLLTAGFDQVDYFGSFSGEPFREDSYHLVFVTRK